MLIILWAIAIRLWHSAPESIPVHFDIAGDADRYGSKHMFLVVAAVGTIAAVLMLVAAYFPHKLINMPFRITHQRQYVPMVRMARIMAVCLIVLMLGVLLMMSRQAGGGYLLAVGMVSLLAVCIFYSVKTYRLKNG